MGKHNDPKWRKGNTFTEEELNPNRPHNYRKTHNGESPIGNINKIKEEMKQNDPERYAEMERGIVEKRAKTMSMKKRAKEILETTIKLTDEEQRIFLKGLKDKGEVSIQDAILYAQASKAVSERDTAAAAFVRDTSGQKPKDEVEVKGITIDALLKNNGVFDPEDDVNED